MDEQDATAGGRRGGDELRERIAAGWSALRDEVAGWLNEQTAFGLSRREVIAGRASTAARATVGACAAVVLWGLIGPSVVARVREIAERVIASGPPAQNAVIAVVIGGWLIGRWFRWAVRRPPVSAAAVTLAAAQVASMLTPGDVDERVARHEAAHAVVAHALGAQVRQLRALPVGNTGGRCEWGFEADRTSAVENAWVSLCALAAGELEVPEGPYAWPGASGDTHEAIAAAALIARGRLDQTEVAAAIAGAGGSTGRDR